MPKIAVPVDDNLYGYQIESRRGNGAPDVATKYGSLKLPQTTQKDDDTPRYGGSGGGGYSLPVIEQPDYSAWFNTLTDIYNKLYDTQKDAIAKAHQTADNKANLNWARNLREWRKMYANERNGQGLSNRLNINYSRDNQLEENQTTADNNLLNAMSGRYTNLAGLTSQLPNMNNDTIKKIMSHVSSFSI